MALHHIAWLRFDPAVGSDRIDEHLRACRTLPTKIPVVRRLICGPNRTMRRADGFTHGIIVTVPSLDALAQYLDHPAHVPVAQQLVADLAELRVMDLEA
jgi:hypothetical protein